MKKELYAYSISYMNRFKKSELSNSLGLIVFNNSIFMLPLFFVELWLAIVITFVYFALFFIVKREEDAYLKGLISVFLFVFFVSFPIITIIVYQYQVLWYALINVLLYMSGYEFVFMINLKQKRYSNNERNYKKYHTLTFSAFLFTTMLGRLFGTFMRNIEWIWIIIIPLLTTLMTFSISYLQRYVIYKLYVHNGHHKAC